LFKLSFSSCCHVDLNLNRCLILSILVLAAHERIVTTAVSLTLLSASVDVVVPESGNQHWVQSCCLIPAIGRVETSVSPHRRSSRGHSH
jgi:hypothetical protein